MIRQPSTHEDETEAVGDRRPYESPRLVEWGSLTNLTQGIKAGFEDFPAQGGSQGV
jgi:hypothetical protein